MTGTVKRLLAGRSGLIGYTMANFLDKLLAFAVPLVVLYVFHDKGTYNEIEYVYSIAAVVTIIIDLGIATYFPYAYRDSTDRAQSIVDIENSFLVQFCAYSVLGLVLVAVGYATGASAGGVLMFVLIRALAALLISFYTTYYRLVDRPARVFLLSIGANVGSVAAMGVAWGISKHVTLTSVLLSQLVLVALAVTYFAGRSKKVEIRSVLCLLMNSVRFAWPIVLNLFLFMFISNYGKVYARNALSPEDMFHISFVQRIALVIQLSHSSAVGYLTKNIFLESRGQMAGRIIGLYSVMVGAGVAMAIAIVMATGLLSPTYRVTLDVLSVVMILYTVVWCYAAFFELYVNRINKNMAILAFSAISAVLFIGILNVPIGAPLVNIALAMLTSMSCNLILTVWYVYRQRRIDQREESPAATYSSAAVQ